MIADGFHNEAFNVVLQKMRFERSVDFWTREVVNAYQTVLNNIYIAEGDVFDGHAVDLLEEIEMDDQLKGIIYLWSLTVTFFKMVTRQTAYINNFN